MDIRRLNKRIKDFGWVLSRASSRKKTRWVISCLTKTEYREYCQLKKELKNLPERYFSVSQMVNSLPCNIWLYRKYYFELVFALFFIVALVLYFLYVPFFKGQLSVFLGVAVLVWYFTSEGFLFKFKRLMSRFVDIQKELEKSLK